MSTAKVFLKLCFLASQFMEDRHFTLIPNAEKGSCVAYVFYRVTVSIECVGKSALKKMDHSMKM